MNLSRDWAWALRGSTFFTISCTQACGEDLHYGKQGTKIHPLKHAMRFKGRNHLWDKAVTLTPRFAPCLCSGWERRRASTAPHGSAPQGREADVRALSAVNCTSGGSTGDSTSGSDSRGCIHGLVDKTSALGGDAGVSCG